MKLSLMSLFFTLVFGCTSASVRPAAVPIVFVHGNGGSSEVWRAQVEHLSKTRRALAIDLPGFGKSPSTGDFSLTAMANAIDSATKAAGIDRFVLVGHSYAGAVVATYAAMHPERVAGVVYIDAAATSLPLNAQQKEQLSAAIRADKMSIVKMMFTPMLKSSSDAVKSEVFNSAQATPAEAFIGAIMSLGAFDPKTITAYTGPKLAIVASDLENPMSFQKQFPDIEAVRISGAGHWLMLDKPDEVNAAIDRFVTRYDGGS